MSAVARAVFAVEGIRCGGCARSIERALRALSGVESVQVNAATGRVAVDWQPDRLTLNRIFRAVDRAGFKSIPLAGEQASERYKQERRTAIKRIGLAGLGMMQTMMFVYGLYAAGPHGIEPELAQYLQVVSMLVTTPVLVYSGAPFFVGAWRNIRRKTLGMDVPVAAAIALAFGASVFNTLRGEGEVYFDSVTMFIFFLLGGRFIEMTARHRSLSSTEALARSLPATVQRIRQDGAIERIPVRSVAVGDLLSIPKGGVIPVDATLRTEKAWLDESLITGEARAVARVAGESLPGGAVNVGETINVVASSDVDSSTIAHVIGLLQRAQAQRPRVAQIADRWAAWFVAVVLLLAAAVALTWSFIDPSRAFAATLAVLVVTCPCAFSLATPAAVAAGTTRLAKLGLLVTTPDALERLAKIDTVVLDKTGTLTTGAACVAEVEMLAQLDQSQALAIAAGLERSSGHPIAAAFAKFDNPDVRVHDVREVSGSGIEGQIDGKRWRLGRAEFALGSSKSVTAADDDVYLSCEGAPVARFVINDELRSDACAATDGLRALGLNVVIASGDNEKAVRRVAKALEVSDAFSRQTPESKMAIARERQSRGERVLMIGDGINDGPVLAAADVSCAMGQGSAVAQSAADLLLLNDSMRTLVDGIRTARRTLAVMRQNLRWAFAYNLCAVPLAALGMIAPWVAAIGMSLSSLLVVLNAQRLASQRWAV